MEAFLHGRIDGFGGLDSSVLYTPLDDVVLSYTYVLFLLLLFSGAVTLRGMSGWTVVNRGQTPLPNVKFARYLYASAT